MKKFFKLFLVILLGALTILITPQKSMIVFAEETEHPALEPRPDYQNHYQQKTGIMFNFDTVYKLDYSTIISHPEYDLLFTGSFGVYNNAKDIMFIAQSLNVYGDGNSVGNAYLSNSDGTYDIYFDYTDDLYLYFCSGGLYMYDYIGEQSIDFESLDMYEFFPVDGILEFMYMQSDWEEIEMFNGREIDLYIKNNYYSEDSDNYKYIYDKGLLEGEIIGNEIGYEVGKNAVKNNPNAYGLYSQSQWDAIPHNAFQSVWAFLTALISGLASILEIELFGFLPIGVIIAIPIIFAILAFILGLFR